MKVLIKQAAVLSSSSPLHGKSTDILIENGIITKISNDINTDADKIIDIKGLHVSAGWMDMFADFSEPGFEFRETLESGANAAAAGGFTKVAIIPNTRPAIDNKAQAEYILERSKSLHVNILPLGCVTKNAEGKELSEMYDLKNSGVIAFTDGTASIQSSGILLKALQYIKAFDGVIIQLPDDKNISRGALMNEGIISTQLGLPGQPAIAEELHIARDIELAKYTHSKIHFTGISTARSVELIKQAKLDGVKVSCSVTPYHLYFTDADLNGYDTNLKVNPPLRNEADKQALINAVKEGTVDCFASHHQPQDWDHKTCEFEYANNGMITLESVFAIARTCGISAEDFVKMQTKNIGEVLNIDQSEIKEGAKANLTLFDPGAENVFEEKDIYSKSRNTPFIGKTLKGKVFGIINADKLFLKLN